MQKLQLYIGTDRVELFKDETVSLTQTIQNVKDIKKVFTEFTQTFSVPASKTNNIIFKHYYNYHIQNGFDARRKVAAKLELNNLPFKNGFISLQGVDLKNNLAHTYRITFFGNTVNLKDILTSDQLSSLSFPNDNKDYSYDDIRFNLKVPPSQIDVIVPLITHTNRLIYNSNSISAFDSDDKINNIYPDTSDIANNGFEWNELKYAIRLQAIITAIQNKYNITFSDDFFNDDTNLKFNDLFMWLHRKSGNVEPATQVPVTYTKVNDLISTNTQEVSSVSGGIITVASTPGTRFANPLYLRLLLTPLNNSDVYSYQVVRDGSVVINQRNNISGAFDISITSPQFLDNSTYLIQILSQTGVTFAPNNIQVFVVWEKANPSPQLPTQGSDAYSNFGFVNITANSIFQFNIVEQIPEIKIIDFISGLFNLFNLTAYVDDSGTIVVRTLDSYYEAGSSIPINIDRYLDTTKSTVNIALPFSRINFSFKGLGTFLAKQFKQLNNIGWGTLSYTLNGEIFDTPSEPYKIEVPFEHMQFERLYDSSTILSLPSTTVQWGYSVNENQQSYKGEPLLFYPVPISDGVAIRIRDTLTPDIEDITQYNVPSNSLALSPSISKININFDLELNEYLANESGGEANDFTDTLFETEYKTYIEEVFNTSRRLTKVTAYLPMKIFYNLKLNDIIQLGQNNYKINSLTTDLTTGKTDFELLNFDIPNPFNVLLNPLEARASYFENKSCTVATLNDLKQIQ